MNEKKATPTKELLLVSKITEEAEPTTYQVGNRAVVIGDSKQPSKTTTRMHFESEEIRDEVALAINDKYVAVYKGQTSDEYVPMHPSEDELCVCIVMNNLDIAGLLIHINRIFNKRFLIRVGFWVHSIDTRWLTPGVEKPVWDAFPDVILVKKTARHTNYSPGYSLKGNDRHPASNFKQIPPKRL